MLFRSALSRTVGYDVGLGPVWLVGAAVALGLMLYALRAAVRAKDTLAGVLSVQFFTFSMDACRVSFYFG